MEKTFKTNLPLLQRNKWTLFLIILFLGLSKFFIMDWLGMRAFYISSVCFLCLFYIYFSYKKNKLDFELLGLRSKNFIKSFILLSPFLLISTVFSILYGSIYLNHVTGWHIIPILVLYPLWGLFQQFIIILMVFQVFTKLYPGKPSNMSLIVIGSVLFSLAHFPDLFLMIFTLCMEIVFLMVFVKWRNLWALGLIHGWVGSFLLFYLQGRDLWIELFEWF